MTQSQWLERFAAALDGLPPGATRCDVEIPENPKEMGVRAACEEARRLRPDFRVVYYEPRRQAGVTRHFLVVEFGPFPEERPAPATGAGKEVIA